MRQDLKPHRLKSLVFDEPITPYRTVIHMPGASPPRSLQREQRRLRLDGYRYIADEDHYGIQPTVHSPFQLL